MRSSLALALLPLAQAINIISSNDDGWAEANIRSIFNALSSAGHSVVLSAPAENQSGSGSRDETPSARTEPCEFDSCTAGASYGTNETDTRLNWVNSYPVTSIKHGIDTISPQFFNGLPDLAVSGPNVGNNLGITVYFSGTVGAASYAAGTGGVPAIAFSGESGSPTAWNAEVPAYSTIYAELAAKVVDRVVAAGSPYLPEDVWLNVNFPAVDDTCTSADDFKFVLSRIFAAVPLITDDDVESCGSTRLPMESSVVRTDGCYVSISVGTSDKTDADATLQGDILQKLGDFLTCLP
ncbi:survival protein sure-like phosphatase/nucleotidase [Aspergillus cavernicola]|uniref:Survival protein sure-like phosphatase/nucleotidase n=1 Tax=Aspergillus cavernicola TaxID=176166 RepID=A0ABR4IEZ3_9EURO